MEKAIEKLENSARELDKMAASTNVALSEMRVQFETMAELHREERLEIHKMNDAEKEKMREHYDKQMKHYKHIIIGLIVTLCIFLGGLFGTVAYFLANFDIEFGTFIQENNVGGDGESTINDGIHYNAD